MNKSVNNTPNVKNQNRKAKKTAQLNAKNQALIAKGRKEIPIIRGRALEASLAKGMGNLEARIAESIALPGEQDTRPYRWASGFSSTKTALAHPAQVLVPTFAQTPAAFPMIGQFEQLSFLRRNYLCSTIYYDQNSPGNAGIYSVRYRGGGGAPPAQLASYEIDHTGSAEVLQVYALGTSTYKPHGPALFAGSVRGELGRFFWLNAGDTYAFSLTCDQNGPIDIQCDYFGPNGLSQNYVSVSIVSVANIAQSITVHTATDAAGYYSLRLKNNTTVNNAVFTVTTGTITVNSSCFCHLTAPDLYANMGTITGVRVLGQSLKYTNNAAFNFKDGKVVARQSGAGDNWQRYISTDSWGFIAKLSDFTELPAENGMYSFLKATQPADMDLQKYHTVNASFEIIDSFWPVDDSSSFVAQCIKVGSAQASPCTLTPRFALEFETTSLWFDTAVSHVPEQAYKNALVILRDVPQFHENPLHFGEIVDKIVSTVSNVAGTVLKYLPFVGQMASMLV